jgi:hypothetical protein
MAYQKTLKVDQLFVRDIIFKDYGNRPISSHQLLVTRGDGVIYFSNAPNTSNIGSFNYVQMDSTFTYSASNPTNTLYLTTGQGVQFTNVRDVFGNNKIKLDSLAPQNLFVFDTNETLSFSSLSNVFGSGRTLNVAGKNDIILSISTNTLLIGSAYGSSISSLYELTSTTEGLVEITSTQTGIINQTLSTINLIYISTGVSTLFSELNKISSTVDYLSTFVFTTFVADQYGNHNNLRVSTINTSVISTINANTTTMTTSNGYASTFSIGGNLLFDTPSVNNSTQDCAIYVSDGIISSVTDYFHIRDAYTKVDFVIGKQFLTSHSTIYGSTYTTTAQIAEMGIMTSLGTVPTYKPITQQVETVSYVVDPLSYSTVRGYSLQSAVYTDVICASSTLNVMAPGGVNLGDLNFMNATGEMANISSLCVSTIEGYSSPIFTFDKVNNRVGLNLGQVQPRATFDVNGTVYANNFVTSSDRRLKTDIKKLEGLSYLSTYSYKFNGEDDIGVLADEVEAVMPSCVYNRPDGLKAVSYQKLVPVLLSYIHDLNNRLKVLENKKKK